jgi:hypothetical protein
MVTELKKRKARSGGSWLSEATNATRVNGVLKRGGTLLISNLSFF